VISRVITAAFGRPAFTLLVVLVAAAFGAGSLQQLRRDVFPDLSTPVFNVIVQNPAMGAEELEVSVAIPMESALAGLPEVRRIRSSSQLGVSQV
jgi:cobalt-zinc-cadmium resistance protein CzcA